MRKKTKCFHIGVIEGVKISITQNYYVFIEKKHQFSKKKSLYMAEKRQSKLLDQ
jgi:hypothetical protein